jgi:hypothetical protein
MPATWNGRLLTLCIIAFLVVFAFLRRPFPVQDWDACYYPVGVRVLHSVDPYIGSCVMNPPQLLPVLATLAAFGQEWGRGILAAMSLAGLGALCWKYKLSPLSCALFLLSAFPLVIISLGQIDVLVLAGLFIPPTWGLPVLIVKPQLGAGYVLYHIWQAWRDHKFIHVVAPLAIILIIGVVVFPQYLLTAHSMVGTPWNSSLFPYGLPIAAVLMLGAVKKKSPELGLAASAFMAPYMTMSVYIVVQIAVMATTTGWRRDALMLVLFVVGWLIWLSWLLMKGGS